MKAKKAVKKLAMYQVFKDNDLSKQIDNGLNISETVAIYKNAKKQIPEAFEYIESKLKNYENTTLRDIYIFEDTFNYIWEIAHNSFYEGYPIEVKIVVDK